jgi:hypothetical protein
MTISTERAVLAGGCFWGMQGFDPPLPGGGFNTRAIQVATFLTPPTEITEHTRNQSRSSLIRPRSTIGRFSSFSSRSTIPTAKETTSARAIDR